MKSIVASQAFSLAPPRRPAVLCMEGAGDGTRLVATEWFSWLNTRRQPMLSFSMPRDAGVDLRDGDEFILAFPPVKELAPFEKDGMTVGAEETAHGGAQLLPFGKRMIPASSEIVLRCTLSHAYNYPFKKVRIYNCDLEEAFCAEPEQENGQA